MIVHIIQALLVSLFAYSEYDLITASKKHNKWADVKATTPYKWGWGLVSGFTGLCLDTLGIGSFAVLSSFWRPTKICKDINLPGTLNCGTVFGGFIEAFIFIAVVDCDVKTIIFMCISAAIGAYLMAGIVVKWDVKKLRICLGICLIACAFVMVCKNVGFGPFGEVGTAQGLYGWKLVVGCIFNFIWGALMNIGFGIYAPCMATCIMLGCDPVVTFPIFMCSCCFEMPFSAHMFYKEGRFDLTLIICLQTAGIIGVFIAAFVVTSLPIYYLLFLIAAVLLFVGITLIRDGIKNKADIEHSELEAQA